LERRYDRAAEIPASRIGHPKGPFDRMELDTGSSPNIRTSSYECRPKHGQGWRAPLVRLEWDPAGWNRSSVIAGLYPAIQLAPPASARFPGSPGQARQ